jgi:hypothetical protein
VVILPVDTGLILSVYSSSKKGVLKMKSDESKESNLEIPDISDKITFKTPKTTYSFSQSWLDNEALKGILVDLIVDDL